MNIELLKFPIGHCQTHKSPSKEQFEKWIEDIESFPQLVEELVHDLSVEELNWKYRPEGWSIKQVVHHCADSHMNSLIRFKLGLTEDKPTIRPYMEDKWAELTDSLDNDVSDSLLLLKALHSKWVKLLSSLSEDQLQMEFIHPDHGERVSLVENIGIYAWHSNHHLAHIRNAIQFGGKYN